MFTAAKPVHYCGKEAQEYIWLNPEREWYEIVLLRGETTRRERIRSGLGNVTIHL